MADTAGLQLSLSLAYSIYSLKEMKKMDLGMFKSEIPNHPIANIVINSH